MPSPAPCPTPQGCPNPEPCSEVMDAQCVIYSGNNILCDQDIIVTTNDNVAEALENIVDYFCGGESSTVTLTDSGTSTHESLVNDGAGPTLATKGLSSGKGITLTSTATNITINAAVSKYVTPGIAAGSTVNFGHGLNTIDVVVSARGGVTGLDPIIYGPTGFTYTIIDPTQMSVTNNTANNISVTIIG